jgi:hypothetical protein
MYSNCRAQRWLQRGTYLEARSIEVPFGPVKHWWSQPTPKGQQTKARAGGRCQQEAADPTQAEGLLSDAYADILGTDGVLDQRDPTIRLAALFGMAPRMAPATAKRLTIGARASPIER